MAKMLSLQACIDNFNRKQKVYIPLYQRNYKWFDKKENAHNNPSAEKLIEDLINHYKDEKKINDVYYLGMITVYDDKQGYQVLDGQQRMITLSLIIKSIEDLVQQKLLQTPKWFKLEFERDPGFDDVNSQDLPRHNAIYKVGCQSAGVDAERMNRNYRVIKQSIENASVDYGKFHEFIMSNISIVFRETQQEPVEEFLNMNFNKTPFGTNDYLKSYMVMDCNRNKEVSTPVKIVELWKKLQSVLYKLDGLSDTLNLENEMYKLIKHKYENIVDIQRMEMLFSDRYEDKGKQYLDKDYDTRLEEEYNQLTYYYKSMQSVLDEFWIVDQDGKEHPNYNVYSAYKLLCKQHEDTRFFKLLNNSNNTDVLDVIYNKFNLVKAVGEKESKSDNPNLRNQFMESLLVSKKDEDKYHKQYENTEKDSIYDAIKSKKYVKKISDFQDIYNVFEKNFDEYVEIINKGKSCINQIRQGKLSLNEIINHPKVKQIKIPLIQRDYVMGSNKNYLKKYLEKLSFYYWWNCFNQIKSSLVSIEEYTVYLFEKIVFINNNEFNGKIINPLIEINPNAGQRKQTYTDIASKIPELKKQHIVSNFGYKKPSREYEEFCNYVNKLKKSFDTIIRELKKTSLNEPITKEFNSSVIMGYLDSMGTLWIYDGQQRLTTSLALIGYFQCDMFNKQLTNIFSFEGRDGANNCFNLLYQNSDKQQLLKKMKQYIDDKTSHSIYRLIENYQEFSKAELVKINTEFLLHGVQFEFVQVDSIDDAEQLFMDLNDGLKLYECEKYKAELSYKMGKIYKDQADKRRDFLLLLDNKWLNKCTSEEKEIEILQWCIQQSYFERIGYTEELTPDELINLDEEVLKYAKEAMDVLSLDSLNLTNISLIKSTWICILLVKKGITEEDYTSITNEIKFGKDFKEFIELYDKFAKAEGITNEAINKQIYGMIKEFRDKGSLKINQNREDKSEESLLNNLCMDMLRNRINKAEFDEIIKWERSSSNYRYVKANKKTSYFLANTKIVNLQINKIKLQVGKAVLSWHDVVGSLSHEDIKYNLEYYLYKQNKEELIEISFDISKATVQEWQLEFLYNKEYLKFDNNKQLYNRENKRIILKTSHDNNEYYYITYEGYSHNFTADQINTLYEYLTVKGEFKKEDLEKDKFNIKADLIKRWSQNKRLSTTLQYLVNFEDFYTQIQTHECSDNICNEIKIKRGEKYLPKFEKMEDCINYLVLKKLEDSNKLKDNLMDKIVLNIEKVIEVVLTHYKYISEYTNNNELFKRFIAEVYFRGLLQNNQSQELEKLYWIAREYLQESDSLRKKIFEEYIKLNNLSEQTKKKIRRLFKKEDFKTSTGQISKLIIKEKEQYLFYIGCEE